jgi:energy-coupling factor transport system permease protein
MPVRIKFDPRTKLAIIIMTTLIFVLNISFMIEIGFVIFLSCLLFLNGNHKMSAVYLLIFASLAGLNLTVFNNIQDSWSILGSFLLIGGRRILPTIMAATFAMTNTQIGEWVTSLQKLKIPFRVILPLVIVFRYFPTLFHNTRDILKALKFRGLITHNVQLIVHPIRSVEYLLVPILMSTDEIIAELSAVVFIRGMGNQVPHTSIYPNQFRWRDGITIGSSLLLIIGGVTFD